MLYINENQLQFALIMLFSSIFLSFLTIFVHFLASKIKFSKFKMVIIHIIDFFVIIAYVLVFVLLSVFFNYGAIRLYSVCLYVLPMVATYYLTKRIKEKEFWECK